MDVHIFVNGKLERNIWGPIAKHYDHFIHIHQLKLLNTWNMADGKSHFWFKVTHSALTASSLPRGWSTVCFLMALAAFILATIDGHLWLLGLWNPRDPCHSEKCEEGAEGVEGMTFCSMLGGDGVGCGITPSSGKGATPPPGTWSGKAPLSPTETAVPRRALILFMAIFKLWGPPHLLFSAFTPCTECMLLSTDLPMCRWDYGKTVIYLLFSLAYWPLRWNNENNSDTFNAMLGS